MKVYDIPNSYHERKKLRRCIEQFMREQALVPPLSMGDIDACAEGIVAQFAVDSELKAWIMVEVNNCAWRETVASIPYEKRLLLLPKCLSNSQSCKADVDELGLLCHRCTLCQIPNLQDEADRLGMISIVAEGFTTVVGLIEEQVVDTVIGVSCLDSLERAFPLLINHAVPGLAIPLNTSGCKDTDADFDYIREMMLMRSDDELTLLDYEGLQKSMHEWFAPETLRSLLSSAEDQTSQIAHSWLSGKGKRWRPYLLAATYSALSGEKQMPQEVMRAAVAVECFHKASLVHDDIQDKDAERYGEPTVHAQYGDNIAINVGDMLLGEGYKVLAQGESIDLLRAIAEAHVSLCKGQGMELEWCENKTALPMDYVLEIFRHKTVPAFDVALKMGAICAHADAVLLHSLSKFSQALGIAYQLKDDLEDFDTDAPLAVRPSAVLAIVMAQNEDEAFQQALLACPDLNEWLKREENKTHLEAAILQVKSLLDAYKSEVQKALHEMRNMELKRLLFRITNKMLG